MSETSKQVVSGVPWAALMVLALALLKLTGKIAISWWWVWCPVWMPLVIGLGVLLIIVVGAVFVACVS